MKLEPCSQQKWPRVGLRLPRSPGDLLTPSFTPRRPPQRLTWGVEHDQGVLLPLQGLPEVVPRQMQHAGLLLFPGGVWGWRGLGAKGIGVEGRESLGEMLPPPPQPRVSFIDEEIRTRLGEDHVRTRRWPQRGSGKATPPMSYLVSRIVKTKQNKTKQKK